MRGSKFPASREDVDLRTQLNASNSDGYKVGVSAAQTYRQNILVGVRVCAISYAGQDMWQHME